MRNKYILFGEKGHPSLSWWENFASGHTTIGKVTIFGANAMCYSRPTAHPMPLRFTSEINASG